jgi:aryl-alcohol dehydrogenase-like predicted oxidoreductase
MKMREPKSTRSALRKPIGLSEVAPDTIRRASRVHPVAALQTEYSLFTRDPEDALLPVLRELGIALDCASQHAQARVQAETTVPPELNRSGGTIVFRLNAQNRNFNPNWI